MRVNHVNVSGTIYKITNTNYSPSTVLELSPGNYAIIVDKYKSGIYTNIKDTIYYSANSTNEYDVTW